MLFQRNINRYATGAGTNAYKPILAEHATHEVRYMEMRTFVKNDNGKVYIKLDPYGNQKRVYLASLFMNRLLKPKMGMAAIAEYQVARLMNGASKENQWALVNELVEHRFMSTEQANILLKPNMITDKGARSILMRYTMGETKVHASGSVAVYNDGKP